MLLMGNFGFTVHPGLGLQPDATEQQDGSRPRFVIPAGADEHYELLRWTYSGDLQAPLMAVAPMD